MAAGGTRESLWESIICDLLRAGDCGHGREQGAGGLCWLNTSASHVYAPTVDYPASGIGIDIGPVGRRLDVYKLPTPAVAARPTPVSAQSPRRRCPSPPNPRGGPCTPRFTLAGTT